MDAPLELAVRATGAGINAAGTRVDATGGGVEAV
jgi:hypothetical protein